MSINPTTVPTGPAATDVPAVTVGTAATDVPADTIGTAVTAVPATPATLGIAPAANQASNPARVEEAAQVLNVFDTPSHTSGEPVDVPETGTANPGSTTSPQVTEPFYVMQTSIQTLEQLRRATRRTTQARTKSCSGGPRQTEAKCNEQETLQRSAKDGRRWLFERP